MLLTSLVQLSVLDQLDNDYNFVILDTMNFWMDTALDELNKAINKTSRFNRVHMAKRHYGIVTKEFKLVRFYYDVDEWELYDRLNDDP